MDQRNSFSPSPLLPSPLRVSEEISNASFPNRRATIVFDFIYIKPFQHQKIILAGFSTNIVNCQYHRDLSLTILFQLR